MITLKNVTLRHGAKVLLDNASVTLNPGEKVGLVGRNGAGKSSLFGLLDGSLHEDAGDYSVPTQWRMGQVAQDMPETTQGATEFVIEGDTRLLAAQAEVQAAEAGDDGDRMAHAYMELHDAGAHDAPARAQALILGLGFKTTELDNPVNSFSGGWRMRLQLARALMCPSDLLLLDEPTNHLDLDALVWLETWLKRYEGTLLVISHDREFLDAVTNVTLHIDMAKLVRYSGNYSKFEDMRAEQMELQQNAFAKQLRVAVAIAAQHLHRDIATQVVIATAEHDADAAAAEFVQHAIALDAGRRRRIAGCGGRPQRQPGAFAQDAEHTRRATGTRRRRRRREGRAQCRVERIDRQAGVGPLAGRVFRQMHHDAPRTDS